MLLTKGRVCQQQRNEGPVGEKALPGNVPDARQRAQALQLLRWLLLLLLLHATWRQ
jgi:hypothetical protein